MRKVLLFALLVLSSCYFFPQAQTAAYRQRYVFFSNLEQGSTEQKINDYAAKGYRLVGLQTNISGAFVAMLEDVSARETRYEYKLIEGTWVHVPRNPNRMDAQLEELGAQGYRVFRGSLLFMRTDHFVAEENQRALALERIVGADQKFEYREDRAMLIGNAQKDLQAALHDRFEPIFTVSRPGERDMLFERGEGTEQKLDATAATGKQNRHTVLHSMFDPAALSASAVGGGVVIRNAQPKNAAAKLSQDIKGGMHILALSTCGYPPSVDALLAKLDVPQPMQFVVTEAKGRRNDVIAWQVRQWLQVQRDLNAAAAKGYAISVRPVIVTTANFSLSEFTQRFLAPMESVGSGPKVQYRTIQASSLPALSEQVNKAADDGWSVVPGLLYGDDVVILQKEAVE